MNDGRLIQRNDKVVIGFDRVLDAARADVWQALVDEEQIATWFPCEIHVDVWAVGAVMTFHFDIEAIADMSGTILEFEDGRRLAFSWGEEILRFELHDIEGGKTRLVFTDELDKTIAARNAAGWDECLDRLEHKLSPIRWSERFAYYVAEFEPQLGPQAGPPQGVLPPE